MQEISFTPGDFGRVSFPYYITKVAYRSSNSKAWSRTQYNYRFTQHLEYHYFLVIPGALGCVCRNRSSKNTENKLLVVDVFPEKAVWEEQKWWEDGASFLLGWTGQVAKEYGW